MLPALTLLNGLPAISPSRGRAIPYERRPLIRPRSARPPSTGWGEEDAAARPAISSPQRGEGGEGESPSRVRGQERSQTSICDCPASRGEISRHLRLRQSPAVQSLQELRQWVFLRAPLWPAGPGPSLWLRAFVIRKAKSLAFRRLRRPLLTPRKGGDRAFIATIASRQRCRRCGEAAARVISPLEGEMAGRPEGGNVEHRRQRNAERRRQRTPAHEERS